MAQFVALAEELGMKTKLIAILFAFLAMAGLVLVSDSPASAAPQGWTTKVCSAPAGYDARICTNMYIDSDSNVNWIQICSTQTQGLVYQGTKNNGGWLRNSNYILWGPTYVSDTGATDCESSATGGIHVGNGAWLFLNGTLKEHFFSDGQWATCQYVTGATC